MFARFPSALICAFGMLMGMTPPAHADDVVSIDDGDLTLRAILVRPQGPGPFPAVVALHGCGGLGNRRNALDLRFRDWAERLVAEGYAVIFPDSFGSRGAGSQCRVRARTIRPRIERVRDAHAARRWLLGQSWVKPDRVYVMGWSNGGSTTLWAVRPQAAPEERSDDFRAAIALYPGCRAPARRGWVARIPTLILIGAADDWTPAAPCVDMVEVARNGPAPAEIVVYPGAHHGFDHPNLPLRQRTGLALTPNGRAHVGTDPAGRADAIRRITDWLKR